MPGSKPTVRFFKAHVKRRPHPRRGLRRDFPQRFHDARVPARRRDPRGVRTDELRNTYPFRQSWNTGPGLAADSRERRLEQRTGFSRRKRFVLCFGSFPHTHSLGTTECRDPLRTKLFAFHRRTRDHQRRTQKRRRRSNNNMSLRRTMRSPAMPSTRRDTRSTTANASMPRRETRTQPNCGLPSRHRRPNSQT